MCIRDRPKSAGLANPQITVTNRSSPDEGKQEPAKQKIVTKRESNHAPATSKTPPKIRDSRAAPPAHTNHTQKHQAQPAQPGTQPIHKQKYIGTLSSSQTTHAHPHQPAHNQSALSSGSQRYTQGKQKSKSRTTPTKQPANQACNTVKLSRSHCDLLARGNEKILNHLHNKHANPPRSGGFQASKAINKR